MSVITGGAVSPPGVRTPGTRPGIYVTTDVPTDALVSSLFTPSNGDIAVNTVTGFVYERQATVWVRIDTV
jgi:hypothetical protein